MNLNVNRVFTITQKALPLLRNAQKKDGVARVINVSGIDSCIQRVTYAYAKHHLVYHVDRFSQWC
jgi:NAD(P)-dependent dehydrogenase (short-subunit alcohol dehydrogenase family)